MLTFATAVNCLDGRTQEPVRDFLKSKYGAAYVDMITEHGPEKILAEDSDKYKINSIKQRIEVSVSTHGSEIILISGHSHCGGNLVEKDIQIAQILNAAATIRQWFPKTVIVPVWIGEDWQVEML